MAGTNLYSVSRALSRWNKQSLIEAKRQVIKVRDRDRLLRLHGTREAPVLTSK